MGTKREEALSTQVSGHMMKGYFFTRNRDINHT